ncbi:MAG TPA: carboxypeptidase regulatory-like domain-containing protein [Blastocatellia bacterium]
MFLTVLGATRISAQDITGTIAGLVKDAGGAVVAGATVTIRDTDKNVVVRTVTTNSQGVYSAPLLLAGHYSLSVEASGFKKFIRNNIEVNVNDRLTVDASLEVGKVEEEVVIETAPLEVELQTATQGGLVTGKEIRELPLNNRNYLQLLTLQPGVSSGASDQLYIGTTNPAGQANTVQFAINGGRTSQNNFTVDGADIVDRGSNLTLLNFPSVDAIAEFKVLRNHYSAEYGRNAAGQVNVVTRTGGQQFHGGAYEFFRNDILNAGAFFDNRNAPLGRDGDGKAIRPPLRYNNFGYTIGGPALIPGPTKDKLFFFFSEEFRRVITSANVLAQVPTAGERQGVFAVPVCVSVSGTTCTQVLPAGTPITALAPINPVAAGYLKDIYGNIPLPNGPGNLLTSSATSVFNFRQELARLDYNYSENLAFAFRFINDSIPTQEPGGLFTNNTVPGIAATKTDTPGRNFLFRVSQALSPKLFNETGVAYSYGAINSSLTGLNSTAVSPDINAILPFASTLARIPNISPGYAGVSGFGPYAERNRNFNVYDNVIVNLGAQALKFGVSFNYYQKRENAGGNNVGTFNFAQAIPIDPSTGVALATTLNAQRWAYFLTGQPSNFTQDSLDATPDIRAKQVELYAQDDYRFRPNLTFNIGVRYSLFRQPTDKNGNLSNFNPNFFNQANAFQIDARGNRVAGTGDPLNGIILGGMNSPFGDKVADEDYGNIAPVFGFAWDPFKDGKTAVRGGYGISYDTSLFGIVEQSIFTNPPLVTSINLSNPSLSNPAASFMASLAPLNLRGTSFDSAVPYVQQYSLDVQREVLKSLIVDVGYFGSKGTNLLGIVDLNQVQPGLAASLGAGTITAGNTAALLNALRPYRGFAAINATQNWFNSNYNSLQIGAEKRFATGSLIKVAYTFSHNLTDAQTDRSTAPQNVNNLAAEYGPASFDRRHIFTVNYVYELPFFRDQKGVTGLLLGGWQLSGITTYASGVPFTATTTGVDPGGLGLLTGGTVASPRPDMISDPNSGAPHTIAQWFNTGAFANVPAGTFRPGNSSRGSILGPGYGRWDLALARVVKINEGLRLQLRGEMFNIFNHTNPLNISASLTDPLYGQVTSARDPRLVQLGLKLNF